VSSGGLQQGDATARGQREPCPDPPSPPTLQRCAPFADKPSIGPLPIAWFVRGPVVAPTRIPGGTAQPPAATYQAATKPSVRQDSLSGSKRLRKSHVACFLSASRLRLPAWQPFGSGSFLRRINPHELRGQITAHSAGRQGRTAVPGRCRPSQTGRAGTNPFPGTVRNGSWPETLPKGAQTQSPR